MNQPGAKRRAAAAWSGGKDSCLAVYLARQQGYQIQALLNFVSRETDRVAFQGLPREAVRLQAAAMGVALTQEYSDTESPRLCQRQSEARLRRLVLDGDLGALVCGHIGADDIQRTQVQQVCSSLGLDLVEPLYSQKPTEILEQFLSAGFEAVIAKVDTNVLGTRWLGKRLDRKFISHLMLNPAMDLCGDRGEYHSLVTAGPIFDGRLEIEAADPILEGNSALLNITKCRLVRSRKT